VVALNTFFAILTPVECIFVFCIVLCIVVVGRECPQKRTEPSGGSRAL